MICDNLGINCEGHLTFSGLDTTLLAQEFGTPSYILDENKIREKCRIYKQAFSDFFPEGSLPLYAGKALCFKGIYKIMQEEGMGIDVVSPGELYTAYAAGFPMKKAFFHGNNKTDSDIAFAIEKGIGYFVCDNIEELCSIDREAEKKGIVQNVILRLTPGIDPHTHKKISTGSVDSKFGAAIETGQAEALFLNAHKKKNICVKGFHCHIGSQIFDTDPFLQATEIMLDFIAYITNKYGFDTKILNLGGGMGVKYTDDDPLIDYRTNICSISEKVNECCEKLKIARPVILMEPGRSIVADAGLTLYSAGTVKEITGFKNYVSIDGGMADNPRYTLYGSKYTVFNASKMNIEANFICTLAGRCCESGDLIQENITIPKPERGDIIAVLTTGAYNFSMASNYNCLCKPPVIMIKDGRPYVSVKRETFEDLVSNQI